MPWPDAYISMPNHDAHISMPKHGEVCAYPAVTVDEVSYVSIGGAVVNFNDVYDR